MDSILNYVNPVHFCREMMREYLSSSDRPVGPHLFEKKDRMVENIRK